MHSFLPMIRSLMVALALLSGSLATAQTASGVPGMPGVAAPAPVAAAAPETSTVTLSDGYVLGVGDVVEVTVLGREEFRSRVQVQTDGTIALPFISSVNAANRTVLQLRDEVQQRLVAGGFYAAPVVAVNMVTYASRYVVVLGEVATPGLVPIDRSYRMSEIMARVGGIRPTGSQDIILRRATGEEIKLNMLAIATGGPEQDPVANPGDKIFVAKAEAYYIYGQVAAPGAYPVEADMTLRMALARGGGLTSLGSEKRIKVIRNGVEMKRFPLGDKIRPDDVVVVGERYF